MYNIEQVKSAANGRWLEIVNACGMNIDGIKNRHEACPLCDDGVKRFRMDDNHGDGSYICNHCGAGSGLNLVTEYMGDFKKAIDFVAGYLGINEEVDIDYAAIEARKAEAAERNRIRAQQEADQKQALVNHAAEGAKLIMQHAEPNGGHQYLTSKQIIGKTAWFMPESFLIPVNDGQRDIKGALVIPAINEHRETVNCQVIQPDGFKMFLLNAQITGCFHTIGRIKEGDTILIGEGYATMDTLRQVTGQPCVVAFNSNNLLSVALIIDTLYPSNKKLITGDNDHHNNNKKCGNAGLTKAHKASQAINCDFVAPPSIEGQSDFNDYFCAHGFDALRDLLISLKAMQLNVAN